MSKRKKVYSFIIFTVFCAVFAYLSYNETYSNEGILEKVTEREGYTLSLIKNNETVEFYVKPEWIPFNSKKEKEFDIKITTKENTNIILDSVWNREIDIYFTFDTTYNLDYNKGRFMYNGIFNEDGTYTTTSSQQEYYLYNHNKELIDVGQFGRGPNSAFGFAINPENYDLIKDGFYVRYSGFYLYEYTKN